MREELSAPLPEQALAYFRRPRGHFWRWVEEGKVIEWRNSNTICYREELARVLRSLTAQGLPALAPVLLLLAACADTWPAASGGEQVLENLLKQTPVTPTDPSPAQLERRLQQVLNFMAVIRALPPALRSDVSKLHLFREVFQAPTPQLQTDLSSAVLVEWDSGRLDEQLYYSGEYLTRQRLWQELDCLAQALDRFPTPDLLALRLRTGLDKVPEPLPAPEPLVELLNQPSELFDQLAQDQRTAGLAHLTRHLVASLRIPMHLQGASTQPLGGVADITNRGNFDQLLLSELAHDDVSFVARLVNNEALYLRREEPPRPQARPHVLLLDTTLRLWGTPRAFGLAAALAWAQQAQMPRSRAVVTAYALGGQDFTPLDLTSFEGVVESLSQLDPALHCGAALHAFGKRQALSEATDYLLITEAQVVQQADFSQQLAATQPALRFLLTVDRSGALELYEYSNGHRTLVSTTRYDLDELLFATRVRRPLRPATPLKSPAFLQCVPAPLYFPTTGLRMSGRNTFYRPALGVLGISETRRVLYWPSKATGARELLPAIEAGTYYFGTDEATYIAVLVSGPGLLRVYFFTTTTEEVELVELEAELDKSEQEVKVAFKDDCYHVRRLSSTLVFDCQQRVVKERRAAAFPTTTFTSFRTDFGHLKRFINSGYNALHRVKQILVNSLGELVIEGHQLRLIGYSQTLTHGLQLMSIPSTQPWSTRSTATLADTVALPSNEQVLLRRFTWPDGSEAVVDSRGLLHLRSADATLPELTVLLVLGHPTAAWAADGTVTGSTYFTGPNPTQHLPPAEFYRQYLQRFTAPLV
ncbi:MAG: hypothetical protein ACRYG7_20185 [Janthinobacterium lividum]